MSTPVHEGPLEVFKALRAEIDRRSNQQQALLSLQVAGSTALTSVALANRHNVTALLTLPLFSLVFGAQWYDHRLAIRSIGNYIRDDLGPRVPGLLDWESTKPKTRGQWVGVLATYAAFPVASIAAVIALVVAGAQGHVPAWAIVGWSVALMATTVMQIVIWCFVGRPRA
ncbi:hypothetical protein [Streptomyces sp. NPDC046870]|uniref:hypothetical protein n=1 Tax=Streptomyces sp. NPDC046870 TaxID=3155135 RepID=UPI003456F379